MRRALQSLAALGLVLALCAGIEASAQERRYEIVAGLQYPLLSQGTEIVQDIDLNLRFLVGVSDRFSLALVYETMKSEDDLKRSATFPGPVEVPFAGDVDLELYGLQGLLTVSGEDRFFVYLVAGMGRGSVEFTDNAPAGGVVDPLPSHLVDRTDISLWYELGAGFLARAGERWTFRFQLSGRAMEPERPSVVLRSTETALIPNFSVGLRF